MIQGVLYLLIVHEIHHLKSRLYLIATVYEGVMLEADNTYSIRSTLLCYWQVRFLTVASPQW